MRYSIITLLLSLFTGKPGPRSVDLQSILDSTMLMSQAVNLNLSLMKWRLWSELKLDMLGKTRCLLIGAGTLGCAGFGGISESKQTKILFGAH